MPTLPKLAYNVFFDEKTQEAITELNADVRRTLRATLRSVASPPPDVFLQQTDSFLRGWDGIEVRCPASVSYENDANEEYSHHLSHSLLKKKKIIGSSSTKFKDLTTVSLGTTMIETRSYS